MTANPPSNDKLRQFLALGPAKVLEQVRDEMSRRESEETLLGFTKHAWPIIEPSVEFRNNWHLEAIADHLEAVLAGDITNLVIAVPPGTMKSILVSVAFPAWVWLKNPAARFFGASYGIELAIRDSQKCRDIITSDWYQRHWGSKVMIKAGDDQKIKYSLTGGGWRIATSVGGRATGEHPDFKIIDDPHNAKQAESDAERQTALNWFDRTLSSRGKSRGAKTIVVAQRFHEKDLSGHILAKKMGYDYLCIPMEFDGNKRVTSIGWKDPRTEKGELLWPDLFPKTAVEELKVELGSYGASGQLQQSPSPVGGGMLNVRCFRKWPSGVRMPQFEFVIQSYDTAFTEKDENDPTACTVWGIFTYQKKHHAMLLDAWDEHLAYPALRKRVMADWSAEYGGGGVGPGQVVRPVRASRMLIEKKASGQSLIQDLSLANLPVTPYNPLGADKVVRAHMASPFLEAGLIWLPESSNNAGKVVDWATDFFEQVKKFPVAAHDDYVDTFTQAIIYFRDTGWLQLPRAVEIDDRPPPQPVVNPYAQ